MIRPIAALFVALAAILEPAQAQAADLSGEFGLVSDYRYRGVSLSGHKPAVQATLMLETEGGAYAEAWGTTLGDGHEEADLTAGFARSLGDGLSLDLSLTYYTYPGAMSGNAFEATALIEREKGPLTVSAGMSVAPSQSGTRDELGEKRSDLYLFGGASYALKALPVRARAQVGYERGPWDMNADGGKWDWVVGLDAETGPTRFSFEHVGSDTGSDAFVVSAFLVF